MTPEQREQWLLGRTTHGAYAGGRELPEHAIWRGMRARCGNPNSKDYPHYGALGVTVCPRWHTYETFITDMGLRPSKDHSLDRIKNEGGYSPENCRWATRSEQQSNKRSTIWYAQDGHALTLTQWAHALGISKGLAHWRINTWGTFAKGRIWQRQNHV